MFGSVQVHYSFFCLAADTHSLALEGHRGTTETVGTDSGHIFDMDEHIARLTQNIMYGMDIVTKLLIFFTLKGLCRSTCKTYRIYCVYSIH